MSIDYKNLQDGLIPIFLEAGRAIMHHFHNGAEIIVKSDNSRVTEADHASDKIIIDGLQKLTPNIPIVTEEQTEAGNIPDISGGTFWVVDPLDGTEYFIKRAEGFSINIGLVVDGIPAFGGMYAPVLDTLYIGGQDVGLQIIANAQQGDAAKITHASHNPYDASAALRVVTSKTILEAPAKKAQLDSILAALPTDSHHYTSEGTLKYTEVADGRADIFFHFGKSYEWDVAAADAMLRAIGGALADLSGKPMTYQKPKLLNTGFYAVRNHEVLAKLPDFS